MTIIEAFNTKKPLTRRDKSWYYMSAYGNYTYILAGTFIEPTFFLEQIYLTPQDILADDWIIKEDLTIETVE